MICPTFQVVCSKPSRMNLTNRFCSSTKPLSGWRSWIKWNRRNRHPQLMDAQLEAVDKGYFISASLYKTSDRITSIYTQYTMPLEIWNTMKCPMNSPVNHLSWLAECCSWILSDLKRRRPPQPVPPLQPRHLPWERWPWSRTIATILRRISSKQPSKKMHKDFNDELSLRRCPNFECQGTTGPGTAPGAGRLAMAAAPLLGLGELMVWISFKETGLKAVFFLRDPCNCSWSSSKCNLLCFGWMLVKNHWIWTNIFMQKHWEHQSSPSKCIIVVLNLFFSYKLGPTCYMCGRGASHGVGSNWESCGDRQWDLPKILYINMAMTWNDKNDLDFFPFFPGKIHHGKEIQKALQKGFFGKTSKNTRGDFARNTLASPRSRTKPFISFCSFCNDHSQKVSHRWCAAIIVQVSWQGSPCWKKSSHKSPEMCAIRLFKLNWPERTHQSLHAIILGPHVGKSHLGHHLQPWPVPAVFSPMGPALTRSTPQLCIKPPQPSASANIDGFKQLRHPRCAAEWHSNKNAASAAPNPWESVYSWTKT